MNIKCPNCGAVHSLDSLINDADASAVLKAVLEMDAELGKAAIRYIGLFRPAKSQLSWARTAKLLNELMPMIKAQEAVRDGVSYPAPAEAWIRRPDHAFDPASERFAGCRYCGRHCANLEPCVGAQPGVGRRARCTALSDGLYGAGE